MAQYDTYGNLIPEIDTMSALDKKMLMMEKAAETKLVNLGLVAPPPQKVKPSYKNLYDREQNQYGSLGPGYTMTENGPVDNLHRTFNNYLEQDMNQLTSDAYDRRRLVDENGYTYLLDQNGNKKYLKDQNSDEANYYMGLSKGNPNELKRGVSAYGVRERYEKGLAAKEGLTRNKDYGYPSGPAGIDAQNAPVDWRMGRDTVNALESVVLGNRGNIERKPFYDDGSPEAIQERLKRGSGASEYMQYNEGTPMLGGVKDTRTGDERFRGPRHILDEIGYAMPETVDDIKNVNSKPISQMNEYEYSDYKVNNQMNDLNDYNNIDSESVAGIKNGIVGFAKLIGEGGDFALENVADAMEYFQSGNEKTEAQKKSGAESRNAIRDAMNTTDKEWKEAFGGILNTTDIYQKEASHELNVVKQRMDNKSFVDALVDGDYLKVAGSFAKNWRTHLSNSAPEMLAIMGGGYVKAGIGLLLAVGARTKKQSAEYKRRHGVDMPKGRELGVFMANALSLGLERIMFLNPMKQAYTQVIAKPLLKLVGKKVGTDIATGTFKKLIKEQVGSAAFEAGQETFDQAVEKWAEQNKGLTLNEGMIAAIGGAVLSVQLGMAPSAIATPGAIKNSIGVAQAKSDVNTVKTGLNKDDLEFRDTKNDTYREGLDNTINDSKSRIEAVNNIKETIDFESLDDNHQKIASDIFTKEAANISDKEKSNFIRNNVDDIEMILDELTNEEISKMSSKDGIDLISDNISNNLSNDKKLNIFYDNVINKDNMLKTYISETIISNSKNSKETISKAKEAIINQINIETSAAKVKKNMSENAKALNDQSTVKPIDRKNEKVDVKRPEHGIVGTLVDIAKTVLPLKTDTQKMKDKLNEYSSTSLESALSTSDKDLSTQIKAVLKNRSEAKKMAGIDTSDRTTGFTSVEPTMGKIKNLNHIQNILSRKQLNDKGDAQYVENFITTMKENGEINDKQESILLKRLSTTANRTAVSILKEEQAARELAKSVKTGTNKTADTNTGSDVSSNNEIYTFTGDDLSESESAPQDIKDAATKVINGTATTAEDIQFQQNNKKAIEKELQRIKNVTESNDS